MLNQSKSFQTKLPTKIKEVIKMTEKMFGNYSSSDDTLNILVTNFKEFESLINKAKKQADELQETINQLEFFNWHFKFTIDKDN